jgi:DNA-binding beta-propeller fold protein YncE
LLYVADTGNRRVVVIDLATQMVSQMIANPAFQEPVDVEVGPDGSLLVLDAQAQAISRVERAMGEVTALALETSFYRPRGLAVDQTSGKLAVADTGGARVVLLDPAGVVLAQFGGPQTIMGQGQPVDALVDGGLLWTITAENGRLWRLDVMGSFVAIERSNTVDGPHLAALPGRGFFLSDPTRRTVLHLASSGQPLAQLVAPGQLVTPTGVAAGSVATGANGEDLLAVADSGACTVWLWRVRL